MKFSEFNKEFNDNFTCNSKNIKKSFDSEINLRKDNEKDT